MSCTGSYGDANDFGSYFCVTVAADEEAGINRILQIAATAIHAARAASGGCDCTLAEWASDYLMQLNCLLAVAVYNCRCSNLKLTQEQKEMYMTAAREDLTLIREGKIELCAGETGTDFAVTGWAEQATTEFAAARIIANDILRNA